MIYIHNKVCMYYMYCTSHTLPFCVYGDIYIFMPVAHVCPVAGMRLCLWRPEIDTGHLSTCFTLHLCF